MTIKLSEAVQALSEEAIRAYNAQLEQCLRAVNDVYGLDGVYRVCHLSNLDVFVREDVMRNGEKLVTVRFSRTGEHQTSIVVEFFDDAIADAYKRAEGDR